MNEDERLRRDDEMAMHVFLEMEERNRRFRWIPRRPLFWIILGGAIIGWLADLMMQGGL